MNCRWLKRGIALTALMTLVEGAPASSQEIIRHARLPQRDDHD